MPPITIKLYPIPKASTEQSIRYLLQQFAPLRIIVDKITATAYVQLPNETTMEALGGKYDDCRITELDGAEIIPLVVNFDQIAKKRKQKDMEQRRQQLKILQMAEQQQKLKQKQTKQTYQSETQTVLLKPNADCLIMVRNCTKLSNLPLQALYFPFPKFQIRRLARNTDNELVIQFSGREQLQKLQIQFDNLKVPQLGPDAVIDPDYVVSANMFMEMLEKERINEEGKREKVRERERRKSQVKNQLIDTVANDGRRSSSELDLVLEKQRKLVQKFSQPKQQIKPYKQTEKQMSAQEQAELRSKSMDRLLKKQINLVEILRESGLKTKSLQMHDATEKTMVPEFTKSSRSQITNESPVKMSLSASSQHPQSHQPPSFNSARFLVLLLWLLYLLFK